MGEAFDLQRALHQGLVPLVWQAADPEATLAAYASLYLREEVQAEALVRQIGDFARFLEVISFSHASLLNLASLAREAEIPRKRAEAYLEILEDLLLAFRLPVFQRRARRQSVQHQKLDVFDAGCFVRCAPGARSTPPPRSKRWRLRGSWPSTCAPSASSGPVASASTSGPATPGWRWISRTMGRSVSGRRGEVQPPR